MAGDADGDDLVQAIHADPDDDAARAVYADWLVDRDDPLGELIHLETTLARLPMFHPKRPAFARRRTEIFDAHLRAWWLAFFDWEPMFPRFHRGFLEAVHYQGSGIQDLEQLDAALAERIAAYFVGPCACGRVHHAGMIRAADRFPLIRRFGGLDLGQAWRLAPELRLREAIEVRVTGTNVTDATQAWNALGNIATIRAFLAYGCSDATGFERILELPALVHLALEHSRVLVELVAERGVPPGLRSLSTELAYAPPLRAALRSAGRPFVENAMPANDELVLVTNAARAPDMAFIEFPIVVAEDAPPYELPAADRQALEVMMHPPQRLEIAGRTWVLRDELLPGDAESRQRHALLAPLRATPSFVRAAHQYPRERVFEDVGFAIERTGPIYFRVVGLVPHQPLIAVCRVDVGMAVEVDVLAGAEPVRYTGPPPDRERRWRNWVFGVPAANVRESTLQLSISAYRYGGFALFQARFYQPF